MATRAIGNEEVHQPPNKTAASTSPSPPSALLHRSLLHPPSTVTHASGIHLTLSTGAHIIDACTGAAVSILGHANPEVLSATQAQLQTVSYVHTGAYTTTAAESLAHVLLDGNPHGLSKALFVGSGSEAMDAALKLARQYFYETENAGERDRERFVARRQGYHGCTIGAMGVSSNVPRKRPFAPLLPGNVAFVGPAYAYQYQREGETGAEYVARLAGELEAELAKGGVIAFVAEPVVGATSGCVPAPEGYFRAVREVCDRFGVLLILDEVMCGMGRTGTYFAFEQEGIVPDIVTVGKGLGGGYAPIAGVLVSEKIVDGLRRGSAMFNHGQTYQAHPLSCATALAVQTIVKRDGLVEKCAAMGRILEHLLHESLDDRKYVGNIRGRGLFWGIEFVQRKSTKASFEPGVEFGYQVQRKAFDLGVAVYPGAATVDGVKGDHVLIAPPYTVTGAQLKEIVALVTQAYDAVEASVDGGKEA